MVGIWCGTSLWQADAGVVRAARSEEDGTSPMSENKRDYEGPEDISAELVESPIASR